MILFCKRNNIARRGITLSVHQGMRLSINNIANLYNYTVGDGRGERNVSFDETMPLGNYRIFSAGLENDFECMTKNMISLRKERSKEGSEWQTKRIRMEDESLFQYGLFQLCGEKVPLYKGVKKGRHFFDGVELWRFDFEGNTYKVYPVQLGKTGSFLCFYRNDVLVAISEINRKVINHETQYTMYAEDDVKKELLYMMTVQWDFEYYMDMDELSAGEINKIQNHDVREINESYWGKETKEKYDPEFIERIKTKSNNGE